LSTPNCAGETLRYFLICPGDTHWKPGKVRCSWTKLRLAVGFSKNPLAEARWRSVTAKASGEGSRIRPNILYSLIVTEPLSWPSAAKSKKLNRRCSAAGTSGFSLKISLLIPGSTDP
jgi:hypothetical protein